MSSDSSQSSNKSSSGSATEPQPLNAKEFYIRCMEQASSIVEHVEPADLTKQTPDDEWSVADLLKHMLYELVWVPDVVRGKTIAEVGTAHDNLVIGEDIPEVWQAAASLAKKVVTAARPEAAVHLSFADATVEQYLWQVGGDLLIHAWDLAEGIGYVIQLQADLAQALYDVTLPNQQSLVGSGLYGPSLEPDENADIQAKLLALFGRDLNWRNS